MVFLLRVDLADDFGVRNFVSPVMRDVVIGDGFESVGGFSWIRSAGAHPLAKAAKFISIRSVPDGFVFGVSLQLVMAK